MINQEIIQFIITEVEANPNIYWSEVKGKIWAKYCESFDEDLIRQAYLETTRPVVSAQIVCDFTQDVELPQIISKAMGELRIELSKRGCDFRWEILEDN